MTAHATDTGVFRTVSSSRATPSAARPPTTASPVAHRASNPAPPSAEGAGPAPGVHVDPRLLDDVRARLVADGREPTHAAVAEILRTQGRVLGDATVSAVLRVLRSEIAGAGPLDALLADPAVTDVMVNAPDEVWIDCGAGPQRAPVTFPDDAAVRRLAQRLATTAGRRLDDASPYVDARLPDGIRLHAVLKPIAVRGTSLSLRVPRRTTMSLNDLVSCGALPPDCAELLRAMVAARVAFLISGGAGTGKTTLLGALLGTAHPAERLVLIEDSAELTPRHAHVVRLEARPPNIEGAGAVTLRDLVRQALRMRPDRIVVGEVRGAEVTELLASLNTGHEGGCGTIHANSASDVPARLEALAAPAGLTRAALHSQLAAALDVVVHVVRDRDGLRRVAEIHVLERDGQGYVAPTPALLLDRSNSPRTGPGYPRLAALLAGWWRP
ncbi:TadA family conjugal transfer-associated ATPase [Yinghuangia sp. YIM S10712]|uniref:TadA family conjugal transfer-associated ATPase n=1 Tax=Yinghuangia sp. YIM S10712 TaxID=3436930 RepID=UPI003F538115